jgi:putative GTP pyrophosphokinase
VSATSKLRGTFLSQNSTTVASRVSLYGMSDSKVRELSDADGRDRVQKLYLMKRALFERLAEEVDFVLDKELAQCRLKTAAILKRVKTLDSLLEKISRKDYDDPITQIRDIAGVRVVCLYAPDVFKIEAVIRRMFEVVETDDKSDGLDVDRMGYNGHHYVVKLGSGYDCPYRKPRSV